jgi:D-alanyl-D-alanine dipeptidase
MIRKVSNLKFMKNTPTDILEYKDLVNITTGTNQEQLVDCRVFDNTIVSEYEKFDMLPITGNIIYVRKSVAEKLAIANKELKIRGQYTLKVVYGFRSPDVQKKYFEKQKNILKERYSKMGEEELVAYTHKFVASPDVAGHPTGAAVDVTIIFNGTPLNMGTKIADFSNETKIQTYAKEITIEEAQNRELLRGVLIKQGFAPFNGEWWHFSYGDKEWAAFYNKKEAIYGPIDFTEE